MKNLKGIKIIKRANRTEIAAPESKTRKCVFSGKQAERDIASRIGSWVKDLRERQRGEEIASRRRFFGSVPSVAPTAA